MGSKNVIRTNLLLYRKVQNDMTYNRYLKRFLSLQVIIHEIDVKVVHLTFKP